MSHLGLHLGYRLLVTLSEMVCDPYQCSTDRHLTFLGHMAAQYQKDMADLWVAELFEGIRILWWSKYQTRHPE